MVHLVLYSTSQFHFVARLYGDPDLSRTISSMDSVSRPDAMAQMRDIPTSILTGVDIEVKAGVLSILEKKGKFVWSSEYKLNPLYWQLVSYAGQTYLLGYSCHLVGAKAIKKLLVKGCSIELNLPEKVDVLPQSNETFLCVQCGEKITFLKAESKPERNKWVEAIRGAIQEPIYYQPTSARLLQMTNRDSVTSTPALAQHKQRSQEMATPMALHMPQSIIHSLNSVDRMRSCSQRELNNPEIDNDGATYMTYNESEDFEETSKPLSLSSSKSTSQPNLRVSDPVHCNLYTKKSRYRHSVSESKASQKAKGYYGVNEPGYEPIRSYYQDVTRLHPFPSDLYDDEHYLAVSNNDDRSSVSHMNYFDLESGGNNANVFLVNDAAAPEVPRRDYQDRKKDRVKTKRSRKTPQRPTDRPPEPPIYQMDSNQRENTVCLERKFHAYIQRFRDEQFQEDGFIVEVDKTDLSPESIKLVCVDDSICIAALPDAKLHSLLHVDDVIMKVNRQTQLTSIDFCYKLFRTADENKVQLLVKRVMHGMMSHVTLSAIGDVDSLGLEFGNQSQGNEVTTMHRGGLVAKSGSPPRPRAQGVIDKGMLVNWGLVEINQSPVSSESSPADVLDQIQRAGRELALVFLPMDIINVF